MPETAPNTDAPLWSSEQASPWLPHNQALRIFDAFAVAAIIESRSALDPPASCDDGARFLIDGVGINDWLGHNGTMAIAVGEDAANGWYFATVAQEGVTLYVKDELTTIRYVSGAWAEQPLVFRLQDLLDVNLAGIADGNVLKWDASNGVFYGANDLFGTSSTGVSRLQDLTDVDLTGIQDGYVLKYDASNGLFYFAPDIAGITVPLEITATSYDLINGDLGRYLRFTALTAKTINVRLQSTHALTPGGEWHFRNAGVGDLTIVPVAGVLVNPPASGTMIIEPGGTATLKSAEANVFDLIGQTTVLIS